MENRGEGIFIQFKNEAVKNWLARKDVLKQGERLERGHRIWAEEHKTSKRDFPGLPYILMHSLSHLLVTAVSLECGYPASSIRERIYAIPDVGYGILLFPATSDAEGTLGGLVQVGRNIHEHIRDAWSWANCVPTIRSVPNTIPPTRMSGGFYTGPLSPILLISETSCEQHNEFLDRALVVPTVDNLGVESFGRVNNDSGVSKLSDADLRQLATALNSRRVSAPYSELQVHRILSPALTPDVTRLPEEPSPKRL